MCRITRRIFQMSTEYMKQYIYIYAYAIYSYLLQVNYLQYNFNLIDKKEEDELESTR